MADWCHEFDFTLLSYARLQPAHFALLMAVGCDCMPVIQLPVA